MQTLLINNLDKAEEAIRGYALGLFYGSEASAVTFAVVYAEGDQERGGEYSSPDILTVNRQLEVVDAHSEN